MIKLENVKKRLGGREVLRGLSLHVPRGDTMVIIGGSGTGKSVTLKHLVGLLRPDEGRVVIDGEDISRYGPKDLARVRRKFGYLFQSGALLNWLTVAENVALPLRELTNLRPVEIAKRVADKLELLGIAHAANLMPSEISGGMKKRAGLARALILDPPIILYDEPTSGLDPVISARINEMIVDVKRKLGVTAIVVTHDMESAYTVGDHIAMLFHGKVIEVGTPAQIKATRNPFVRQFIEGKARGPITDGHKSESLVASQEDPENGEPQGADMKDFVVLDQDADTPSKDEGPEHPEERA